MYIVPEMVYSRRCFGLTLLGRSCVPDVALFNEWILASVVAQHPPRRMEREQVYSSFCAKG